MLCECVRGEGGRQKKGEARRERASVRIHTMQRTVLRFAPVILTCPMRPRSSWSGSPSASSAVERSRRFSRWSSPFITSTFKFSESIDSASTYSFNADERKEESSFLAAHI